MLLNCRLKQLWLGKHSELDSCSYELFFSQWLILCHKNIHLSSWITLCNVRKPFNLSTCVQFLNPCLPCKCQNVAISRSIFAPVCLKSTVFASCGVLAQLMDGCGHERIVHSRCQIFGEYRAMSLCQLSGSPCRILSVEKGLALCGNVVVHHLRKIVVSSCQIFGGHRTKMGFSQYRWTPVSASNTFQDLPQLSETVDNTKSYM